jgi:predicted RNA-binding protein with PUA-like domain
MNYWMLKSEPHVFSITDLQHKKSAIWDGVRNYTARNFLKTAALGDLAFFYHSSTEIPGVYGLCKVTETLLADPTQFDPKSDYFDPKSTRDAPRWHTVRVAFDALFKTPVTLDAMKVAFKPDELMVVRKGNRLSVMPVDAAAAQRLIAMGAA